LLPPGLSQLGRNRYDAFHLSKWLDLEILLIPGGLERTEGEWHKLFARAGFEITRILPMKAAESLIEARVR
jgi:hypothetical protein